MSMNFTTTNSPEIDLSTLFFSFASAAYMGLGFTQEGQISDPKKINLEVARQNIDILALLQSKTVGNLSTSESKLINDLLFELRMRFVEVQNNLSKK